MGKSECLKKKKLPNSSLFLASISFSSSVSFHLQTLHIYPLVTWEKVIADFSFKYNLCEHISPTLRSHQLPYETPIFSLSACIKPSCSSGHPRPWSLWREERPTPTLSPSSRRPSRWRMDRRSPSMRWRWRGLCSTLPRTGERPRRES